jgi:hypothetical protein
MYVDIFMSSELKGRTTLVRSLEDVNIEWKGGELNWGSI